MAKRGRGRPELRPHWHREQREQQPQLERARASPRRAHQHRNRHVVPVSGHVGPCHHHASGLFRRHPAKNAQPQFDDRHFWREPLGVLGIYRHHRGGHQRALLLLGRRVLFDPPRIGHGVAGRAVVDLWRPRSGLDGRSPCPCHLRGMGLHGEPVAHRE